jgi:hypothetical protein
MYELTYDWDELITRLKAAGCTVTRMSMEVLRRGGVSETFLVEYRGENHPLQLPARSGNPTWTVVRSLCDNLGLPYAPFDL